MPLLPLFPLPNVVLFPGVLLPLHIFEPRYRALAADVLEGDRTLGMVLLRSGWESDYDGRPSVHEIGCSGVIVHAVRLDDGRYNIVLRGLERFRVLDEDHERAYRRARIERMPEPPLNDADRRALSDVRVKIEGCLGLSGRAALDAQGSSAAQLAAMSDTDLVHTLAQYLDLAPVEKQALLERDSTTHLAEALFDLLEMKRLEATLPVVPNVSH